MVAVLGVWEREKDKSFLERDNWREMFPPFSRPFER